MNMIEKESKLSEAEIDDYIEKYLRSHIDGLANLLFNPIPELTREEKDEIHHYFDTSPTWKEKERKLFIAVGGEEYARQKGLLDDEEETVSQNPG